MHRMRTTMCGARAILLRDSTSTAVAQSSTTTSAAGMNGLSHSELWEPPADRIIEAEAISRCVTPRRTGACSRLSTRQ